MTFNLSAKASTNIKLSEEFVVGCVYITLRLKELWKVRNSNRLERLIKLCRCSTSIATKTIKKGVHNTFFSIKLRPPKPLSSIATKTIDLSHQNSKTLTIASHQNLQSKVGTKTHKTLQTRATKTQVSHWGNTFLSFDLFCIISIWQYLAISIRFGHNSV